jgi:hypothetical protein
MVIKPTSPTWMVFSHGAEYAVITINAAKIHVKIFRDSFIAG